MTCCKCSIKMLNLCLPTRRASDTMPSPAHERLTRREREIMNAIFALGGRASAEDIQARLIDPPSYS